MTIQIRNLGGNNEVKNSHDRIFLHSNISFNNLLIINRN